MSQTLQQFKNTAPAPGQILLLRDIADEVIAITISRIDCVAGEYDSSLAKLTGITIGIGDGVAVTVTNVVKYGSYYALDVTPFTLTETPDDQLCLNIILEPFDQNITIDFRNSEFYPIYNNVPESLYLPASAINSIFGGKIEMRRGKNIFDVDRKNDAIIPTNMNLLLGNNANLAEFPESNYTTLANTTGRYLGSKTTTEQYGTNPSLTLTPFDGSIYQATTEISTICSQSYAERIIEGFGYDSTLNLRPSLGNLPTASLDLTTRDGKILGAPAILTDTQTEITANIFNTQASRIKPGRILYIANSTQHDYAEISKVEMLGPVDAYETQYKITLIRGADGVSKTLQGDVSAIPGFCLNLRTIDSDTVYQFENNKAVTLTNKGLYVQETGVVYKVGPKGKLLYGLGNCN